MAHLHECPEPVKGVGIIPKPYHLVFEEMSEKAEDTELLPPPVQY